MANNYSQPYYGFPHGFPPGFPLPQQMQQAAQAEEQRSHHNIPGLAPTPTPPGYNFTSNVQNVQQPPFPPPAWPPHFPPDPNLWALFQTGAFPPPNLPPPPIPGLAFPSHLPPHTPQTPQTPTMSAPLPPHNHLPLAVAPSERIHEVMESDREDGELSEGEVSTQPPAARLNGGARPEPPPSAPKPAAATPQAQDGYNPHHPAAGQSVSQQPTRQAPHESAPTPMDELQRQREEAKQFIKILHSSNIHYRTLANELLDVELLRGLYQSMNLPSEPAPILPHKANGTTASPARQPVLTAQDVQTAATPAIKTNIASAPTAKSAASPTAPGDRKDYIARLQAAKMAKQTGSVKPSPPQQTTPAKASTPVPAVQTPQPATTPTAKPPVTDEQRARNTELIKQRLEAMKSRQKAPAAATNGAVLSTATLQQSIQVQGPSQQVAKPLASGTNTPSQQMTMPKFHGIPGLFMNTPQSIANSAPIVSQPSPTVPQKRPAPADISEVTTPGDSVIPYTRPLGQSPHADQEDESMIIEVSEDDSNGSDMDIDDDQTGPPASAVSPKPAPAQRQTPGVLQNFPTRSGSAIPIASAINTPGVQTPTTVAREKELVDKEAQLVAMRETLKKKLAEKRERDKAAAAAAAASSSPTAQKPPMPILPPHSYTPARLPTPMIEQAHSRHAQTNGAVTDTVHTSADAGGDTKRLRRAEIQSRLPTLDAEIASNASRMAQLNKEMEQLMAHNERIAKDKEQLTLELENLGVDTEGMSHAELRAKKDEIEREQSLEPESVSQGALGVPQAPASDQVSAVQSSLTGMVSGATENEKAVFSATLPASSQVPGDYARLPGLGQEPSQPMLDARVRTPTTSTTFAAPSDIDLDVAPPVISQQVPIQQDVLRPGQADNALSNNDSMTNAPTDSIVHDSATPLDDEEDFYSPPPPTKTDLDVNVDDTSQAQATDTVPDPGSADSPSEEGEVEMSVSSGDEEDESEPEYEPEEPAIAAEVIVQESQTRDLDIARSIPTSQVSTVDEEEAYEPPDIEESMPDAEDRSTTNISLEVQQVEAEDGAMDIATSSDESSDESDSDEESSPEPVAQGSISANNVQQQNTNVADDLAPELQSELVPPDTEEHLSPRDVEDEPARFTPYESPLRMFKSYRYHPSYAQDIAGGFLSWTFSHQIDPEKSLCQYESAGGSCNDPECPDQHFRDIGITGEKLLVQLGTANPGKTPEEKQKWNDGLRGVLKELRQKNIKDPNGIAVEIAKYRRQFLNDDTRVVNL